MDTGNQKHAALATAFNKDEDRVNWHDETLWLVREKRDRIAFSVPDWELLRDTASNIKTHTLSRLSFYLEQFEQQALQNGVLVHWAKDAAEHNEIVHGILSRHQVSIS